MDHPKTSTVPMAEGCKAVIDRRFWIAVSLAIGANALPIIILIILRGWT